MDTTWRSDAACGVSRQRHERRQGKSTGSPCVGCDVHVRKDQLHPIVIRFAVLCVAIKAAGVVVERRRTALWLALATAFALNLLPAVFGGSDLLRVTVGVAVDAVICVPVMLILAGDTGSLMWLTTVAGSTLLLVFELPTSLVLDW